MYKVKIKTEQEWHLSPDGSFKHEYFSNGMRHREDGPAIQWSDGTYEYWVHGQLHREDGPAVKYPLDAGEEFYLNGELFLESKWRENLKCLK